MLNFDVKRKINTLRDILVGKVPDPKAQVEQITIALIYKFMDDIDLEGAEWGKRTFFTEGYAKYAWTEIMTSENGAQQRADLYREGIEKMALNPHLPQLFRDIFRGAYIPYRDPETLNMFLKEINEFSYDNSEDLGNAFEYLLSIMGSQGDAGQFRTPRHIIDMMVKIIDPKKNESILDPACGTAGFLISAYKHIVEHNKNEDDNISLSADDRKFMTENFAGYDISPDMVRLAQVNMYLHKFIKPQISEYDTLSSEEKWNDDYDVILANPPFMTPKGGIIPHKRYRVQAKRAEVLFVDYIAEHLTQTGRAGIIVPEGIVFQSANAYKQLREYLVKDYLLYGVISLPAGVFNPYSGVKTSILLIDRVFAKQTDTIIFAKLNNDGFDLGAQRRDVKGSEIGEIISVINDYKNGKDVSNNRLITIATKEEVAKQGYILVGDRYKDAVAVNSDYPMVELGEVCEVISGQSPEGQYYNDEIKGLPFYQGKTEFTNVYLGNPKKWTTRVTKKAVKNDIVMSVRAPVGPVNIVTENICIGRGLAAIRCGNKILLNYLFNILRAIENQINGNSGAVFASINRTEIEQIKIPLPPLSVQEEIVAEIESYQKIIDGAKQVVENYKPTIKIDPTWEMVKVDNIIKFVSGVTLAVGECEDPEGIPLITIADVSENGYLKLDKIRAVKTNKKVNVLQRGDLLFNWRNGSKHLVGKTALFDLEGEYIFASFLLGIRPEKQKINSFFLWVLLNQFRVEEKYMQFMRQNVNGLFNREELKEVLVPLPSLETQQQIIAKINEEMAIVAQNKRLIEIFEQKIKDKISGIWGE